MTNMKLHTSDRLFSHIAQAYDICKAGGRLISHCDSTQRWIEDYCCRFTVDMHSHSLDVKRNKFTQTPPCFTDQLLELEGSAADGHMIPHDLT